MRLGLSHRVLPRVGCLGVGLLPGRRQNLLGRWPVPCLHDSCSTEEAEFSCCLVLLWGRLSSLVPRVGVHHSTGFCGCYFNLMASCPDSFS